MPARNAFWIRGDSTSEAATLLEQLFVAGEGDVVGRIRLQKIAYLLQARTGKASLEFEYYHYGPFSRDLADALDRAVWKGRISEEARDTGFGTSYSVFRWNETSLPRVDQVGDVPMGEAKALIGKMKDIPSVILELAATIHWIRTAEGLEDWRSEIKARKPRKASEANIRNAEKLLQEMQLAA